MTLSLCMIVKNEIDVLERCLASVASIVDEIIIVDTGSTDGTLDIARRLAHKVIELPWRDDFSYARNVSVDSASSDWILALDADHYLGTKSCACIKDAMFRKDALAYMIPIRNHYDDATTSINYSAILFRNNSGIRYSGRIHEQTTPSIYEILKNDPRLKVEYLVDAIVEHDGTMSKRSDDNKKQKYMRLLEMSVREYPRDIYRRYKYSQILGLWSDKGYENLNIAAEQIFGMPTCELSALAIGSEVLFNASLCWLERNEIPKVVKACILAEMTYGVHPVLLYIKSYLSFVLKDYKMAIHNGMMAMDTSAPLGSCAYDKDKLNYELWLMIAYSFFKMGNTESSLSAIDNIELHRLSSTRIYYAMMDDALSMNMPMMAMKLAVKILKCDCHNSKCISVCADAAEMYGDKSSALRWRSLLGKS